MQSSVLLGELEALEESRTRLSEKISEAGLALTRARWACEQRGAACDYTSIPQKRCTLNPLLYVQVESQSGSSSPVVEQVSIPEGVTKDSGVASIAPISIPGFKFIETPGFDLEEARRRKKQLQEEKKTKEESKGGSEELVEKERGNPSSTNQDPILWVCNPPPPELLCCRSHYRAVVKAIVETANAQIRVQAACKDEKAVF